MTSIPESDFELSNEITLNNSNKNIFDDFDSNACDYYFPKELNPSKSALSILHVNIRGIKTNFENFLHMLEVTNFYFNAICLTETWCTDAEFYQNSLFSIPQYKSFHCERKTNKKGGGIVFYINSNYTCKSHELLNISDSDIEMANFELIDKKHKNLFISCIYRPPSGNIKLFNQKITSILQNPQVANKEILVMGDLNLDYLHCCNNKLIHESYNNFLLHGLVPLISKPTRVTSTSKTIIDNILTNYSNGNLKTGVIKTDLSDHFPIFVHMDNFSTTSSKTVETKKRNFNKTNIQNFKKNLANTDWSIIDQCKTVDLKYNLFFDIFYNIYDTSFPTNIFIKNDKDLKSPWITKGIKKSSKKKQKLYIKFLKTGTENAQSKYKTYKNLFEKIKQKAKKLHYKKLLNKYSNDSKKTWDIIKEVTGKRKVETEILPNELTTETGILNQSKDIADALNKYFTNVGSSLAKNIPQSSKQFTEYLNYHKQNLVNDELSIQELEDAFKTLKRNKAAGFDDINPNMIIEAFEEIKIPLFSIFHESLKKGIFPNALKTAKVTPIFKSGCKSLPGNYRPISILPVFSKILERIVYKRLYTFLKSSNLLFPKQFGFQENSSTEHAIIALVNDILNSFENGKFTLGVFVDLSKAFDTVNHSILLKKLSYYGINGVYHQWFESYLNNRKQCVCYNNNKISEFQTITCGVPQGSILGPLLFLIYVNDINKASSILSPIMFADDTNLFYSHKNINELFKTVNIELEKVSDWLLANKLSINISKTKFSIFHSSQKKKSVIDLQPLKFNDVEIVRSNVNKFLGILLDENISWNPQIKNVERKVSKSIGILYTARSVLDKNLLKTLYYSFVHTHLSYGNIVWASTPKTKLFTLFRYQKHAIKVINFKPKLFHSDSLFKKDKIPTLFQINILQTLCLMFKCKTKEAPIFLQTFYKVKPGNKYITRNHGSLLKQTALKRYSQFQFSYRGSNLWNKIVFPCTSLLNEKTYPSFKNKTKSIIINCNYDELLKYF